MQARDVISQTYEEFGKRGLEVVLLFPTRTGLEKSIFDATRNIASYFLSTGLHDYSNQAKGPENKKFIETKLVSSGTVLNTKTSLYRPLTKLGDFRFWPKGIDSIASAGDVLAVLVRNGILIIINCSSINFSKLDSLEMTLPAQGQTNDVDRINYGLINHTLNNFLFNGRYSQKSLYLNFDSEISTHLSEVIGIAIEDVSAKVFELVKTQLVLDRSNPYSEFVNMNKVWIRNNFSNHPPTTLFLASLVLVADTMSSGDGRSQNNYYDRLLEALNIYDPDLSTSFKSNFSVTEQLWLDFNNWLNARDGEIGIATAFPIFSKKRFISYPISQALLRKGDCENVQKFLISRGFSSTVDSDMDLFGEVLGRWLNSTAATQYLRQLWSNRSLRKFIIQSAYSEIENLPAQPHTELGSGWRQTNLKLKLVRRKFPKKRLELSIFVESKNGFSTTSLVNEETVSGVFENEAKLFLVPSDYNSAYLGPNSSIRLERFLSNSVALFDQVNKLKFIFTSKEAMAFEAIDREFRQVNRPKLYAEHLILLRTEKLDRVQKFLNFCADKNYSVLEDIEGLPKGFCLIEKVRFVKPISVNDWDPADVNYWLLPSSFQTNLEPVGGLRLRGRTYHVKSDMTLFFNSDSDVGTEVVYASYKIKNSSLEPNVRCEETSHSVEVKDGVGIINLHCLYQNIPDGELELRSKGGAFSTTNLSFRSSASSNNPQLTSGLSVSPNDLFKLVSASDIKHHVEVAVTSTCEYDQNAFSTQKFVGDYYEVSPEIDTDFEDYSISSANISELSCIERGHHYWVVPEDASDGIWEGACKQCGQTRLWPAKGKRQIDRVRKVYSLMSRPFLDLDLKDISYDLNTMFDAICYLQSINWNNFKDLCAAADMPDFYEYEFIKSLSLMQHIDVELNPQNYGIAKCHVRPTTLINYNDFWHLSGFHNAGIRAAIERLLGCEAKILKNERSIDSFVFENIPIELLNETNKIILDTGEPVSLVNVDPMNYVSRVADLHSFYSSATEVSIGSNAQLQRFDPARLRWEKYSDMASVGAYRTRWPSNLYFLVDENRRTLLTTSYLGKIYAATLQGLRLHDYNQENKEFVCKVGCDLVPLAERALYACSGKLPRREVNGDLIYENVPLNLASRILNLHYRCS